MIIEFEATIENSIEFVLFHRTYSPSMKSQILISRIISVVMALLIPPILMYLIFQGMTKLMGLILNFPQNAEQNSIYPYIMAFAYVLSVIFGVYMFIQFPKINKEQMIKRLRKLLSEGENKNALGHCTLTLSPEGIHCKRNLSEYKVTWSAIINMIQNDNCFFLYTDSVNAIVIPKDAFASDNARKEFSDYVNNNMNVKNNP